MKTYLNFFYAAKGNIAIKIAKISATQLKHLNFFDTILHRRQTQKKTSTVAFKNAVKMLKSSDNETGRASEKKHNTRL